MPSERFSGKDYFDYFLGLLTSQPEAHIGDVAAHFERGVNVVRNGLTNYLTSNRLVKTHGFLLSKTPPRAVRERSAIVDPELPAEAMADIEAGITFRGLVKKYGGEDSEFSDSVLHRAWEANRPETKAYGRVGQAAWEAWLAAGMDDGIAEEPKFWTNVAKEVGARGPQYANIAAINYATREEKTEIPINIGPAVKRLKLTDEIRAKLGVVRDDLLATELGVATETVAAARRRAGIKIRSGRSTDSSVDRAHLYTYVRDTAKGFSRAALDLDLGLTPIQIQKMCEDYATEAGLPVLVFRPRKAKEAVEA